MKTRIIYQDDAVVVAYKPAGLATQTARVGQADMVSELKNANRGGYLGVVHRLDQPVEGLLVFAKNAKAAAQLSRQLGEGSLNKQYFAAICGKPSVKEGELVDFMVKGKDNLARIVENEVGSAPETGKSGVQEADVKKAVLQYRILEDAATPETISLADIHIETGRFHQIRCQMAHAGMPLLGDAKYGNEASSELSRKLAIRNVALCAYKLVFKHLLQGRKCLLR